MFQHEVITRGFVALHHRLTRSNLWADLTRLGKTFLFEPSPQWVHRRHPLQNNAKHHKSQPWWSFGGLRKRLTAASPFLRRRRHRYENCRWLERSDRHLIPRGSTLIAHFCSSDIAHPREKTAQTDFITLWRLLGSNDETKLKSKFFQQIHARTHNSLPKVIELRGCIFRWVLQNKISSNPLGKQDPRLNQTGLSKYRGPCPSSDDRPSLGVWEWRKTKTLNSTTPHSKSERVCCFTPEWSSDSDWLNLGECFYILIRWIVLAMISR